MDGASLQPLVAPFQWPVAVELLGVEDQFKFEIGPLAAMLLLAGRSPQRRHVLPAHRITAHSGVFNCGF